MSKIEVNEIARRSGSSPISIPGHIIQVKQSSTASQVATTSTSFVSAGVAISITPGSTSNKILLTANIGGFYMAQNDDIYVTIYRDSTNIGVGSQSCFVDVHNDNAQGRYGSASMEVLDSPNTTSSVTYTIYYRTGNSTQVILNRSHTGLYFTAKEVAA